MSFNDTINRLFELGCAKVIFTRDQNSMPAIVVEQSVATGSLPVPTVITHQKVGAMYPQLLSGVLADVEHCAELSNIPLPVEIDDSTPCNSRE